ncbi:peptidylprolyl isomerase [Reinekea sp.]|jgi:peptidyl-prolyl cis-trans isomerase SurA|uniref:peptidylprolyl isomerase n=3 Tax=Reinekea sp. TaxID=1970455 RepID=UPI003988E552
MKQTLINYCFAPMIVLASALSGAQELDRIRAIANDDIVTQVELTARVDNVKGQYRANPQILPAQEILEKQVLDQLILESLQSQVADKMNLAIPQSNIDSAINTIAQRQNLTTEELQQAVVQQGQTVASFRQQIQRELLLNEVHRRSVARSVYVSEAEIERFIASQAGQSLQEIEYQLFYRQFPVAELAEAQALVAKLNDGQSLKLDPNAQDLGLRKLETIPTVFKTIVPVLAEQEAILIETDNAIHLGQLVDKTETKQIDITEYDIRHILIKTDALLDEASARSAIENIRTQIIDGADMAKLADDFSDDTGTRGRGGSLGWATLDTYVGEFSNAAAAVKVNEISDVIQTQFGFHILRVEGTRTRNVGLDVLRNQIRNQLQNLRFQDAIQRWQAELLAESYIEYRP